MSITPQFLDELRARVPISDVAGRFVTWDQRKSSPSKGDYWAPCPFHSEKTASFHVDDKKGFYYCFGCHAKGDAIGFLKDKANLEFIDAVKDLAGMAGMQMPERDPQMQQRLDAAGRLIQMHEQAAKFFALQLSSAAGGQAREYLRRTRRLSEKTIARFGIGLIPNGRDLLLSHLEGAGYSRNEMIQGGLILKPDDGGAEFDRFRNRIMFPIRDARGRVVGFGGRAIDPNARAKYLNSAESPIFHKSDILYNMHNARAALGDGRHLIVTEGYMDVIALAQAGFESAIAPMGTAITEQQLQAIWRVDPHPLIALDGDKAGANAAMRLAELALPLLQTGKSLRFVMLPAGKDPDDLLREGGKSAMRAVLENPISMADLLWNDLLAKKSLETPEARAEFDQSLREITAKIKDQSLRNHYFAEFKSRRARLFAPQSTPSTHQGFGNKRQSFRPFLASSRPKNLTARAVVEKLGHEYERRAALVLQVILAHPELAREFTDGLSRLNAPDAGLEQIRRNLVIAYGDETAIARFAQEGDLSALDRYPFLKALKFARKGSDAERARLVLQEEFNHMERAQGIDAEIGESVQAIEAGESVDEECKRLSNLVAERESLLKIEDKESEEDRESSEFLRRFLESESWRK